MSGSVGVVTVNVTQQIAPTPSNLQKKGAFLSFGGTNTAVNTLSLLTQPADLTPLLNTAKAITSLTWSASVVTVTTTVAHGMTIADTVPVTIAGTTPSGYNGSFIATITGASTFTYPLVSNPGASPAGTPGTWAPGSLVEIQAMSTTFFAQGTNVPVYVLELGTVGTVAGVAALTAWQAANPGTLYSYLVPRSWDAAASFLTLIASTESTTSKTYYWVTTTTVNYTSYTALMKNVNALIEAPTVVLTSEFSQAAAFWKSLSYDPSSTNKVPPFGFSYVFGVTPYPTVGNAALRATLKAANISLIGTGAEGGISNTILLWGNMLDGRPFNYWYSVDWVQINIVLNITNAVINGSNDPLNPLYLEQKGITALQGVAASTMITGATVGLVFGTIAQSALNGPAYAAALGAGTFAGKANVNAVPFTSYYSINPGDFKIGKYAGFSIVYTPQRGFAAIVFNILVTDFVAGSAAAVSLSNG